MEAWFSEDSTWELMKLKLGVVCDLGKFGQQEWELKVSCAFETTQWTAHLWSVDFYGCVSFFQKNFNDYRVLDFRIHHLSRIPPCLSLINREGLRKWCLEFNRQKDSNRNSLEALDDSMGSFLEGSHRRGSSELGHSLWLPVGLCPGSSSLPF